MQENAALALVATGEDYIVLPVTIDVRNQHAGGAGRVAKGIALEMQLTIIEANIRSEGTIRDRDIGIAVIVQISDRRIPGRPFRIAVSPANFEMACSVV